jgi:hypothetical protein
MEKHVARLSVQGNNTEQQYCPPKGRFNERHRSEMCTVYISFLATRQDLALFMFSHIGYSYRGGGSTPLPIFFLP